VRIGEDGCRAQGVIARRARTVTIQAVGRSWGTHVTAQVCDANYASGPLSWAVSWEFAVSDWVLGVIGGSGLYEMDALQERRSVKVDTPWGDPSDEVVLGRIEGVRVAFLPRHGRGHRLGPGEINARANVDALKRVGCTDVVSISSVGSLREDLAPGSFALIAQYIDRTVARPSSFFGSGVVAHVSMAEPTCPRLSALAAAAARRSGVEVTEGVTYLAMEGPQFSTRAESHLYRSWGCDVIGMTAMPEARLLREAELPYANVGMVTDYDCWREASAHVQVSDVLEVMRSNADAARRLVLELARSLPRPRAPSPIDTGLDQAIVTDAGHWDPTTLAKLDAILGRRLGRAGT